MKPKVDAIFELREAAEEHGRVSAHVAEHPDSVRAQHELLDARSKLEAATAEAIDSCHHCGLPHDTNDHERATR